MKILVYYNYIIKLYLKEKLLCKIYFYNFFSPRLDIFKQKI